MYPVGSNGASQAILDARCLADALTHSEHPRQAADGLRAKTIADDGGDCALEPPRRPEGVIDAVEQLAPDGFDNVEHV